MPGKPERWKDGLMVGSSTSRRSLSAGILLYRTSAGRAEVLLGHPGGPYWTRRDEGAWMVPKGAVEEGETSAQAARREFEEEVGPLPPGEARRLAAVRQNGGKLVEVFTMEGEFDPANLSSNSFELEWPPRSGRMQSFPELDKIEWMDLPQAYRRILVSQRPLLSALASMLGLADPEAEQDRAGERE